MARYVYRPDHPLASEHGMVSVADIIGEDEPFGESAYVISDTMEPTRHMATGKIHTSKSEFRKETRRAGCIEIGNETETILRPRQRVNLNRKERVDDIRRAIRFLQSR